MKKLFLLFNLLCLSYFSSLAQRKEDSLYVFVGEKIKVHKFKPKLKKGHFLMDGAYKAKYRIIQNIYGDYKGKTIKFEAYDHYGVPAFSKYKNVMLFVSKSNGKLYHEKYQYFDVYKTKKGKWASPYKFYLYQDNSNIKPELIDFTEDIAYDTTIVGARENYLQTVYPSPYYKIVGNKAVAVYGNYLDELFELKKIEVLRARGYFKN